MRLKTLLVFLALLLWLPPTVYAGGGERTTPVPCGCNYSGSEPYYLGPEFGIWYVDVSGAGPIPTAVNPATGQIAYLLYTNGPSFVTSTNGATYLHIPAPITVAAYVAGLPPTPIQLNLYNPPSTIITGPTQPSRSIPAPAAPNLWNPGQGFPDSGTGRDAAPSAPNGPAAASDHSAGDSPHQ